MKNERFKINSYVKIFIIYFIAVLGYMVFVRCFSIPVHIGVDEELYISMAKSFHYKGNFAKGGEILDYTCVLYSILLSVAFFFYSPENIMFIFRFIGVSVMLTSVFPIYMLSKKILKNEQKALAITIFACILPSMMNTVYCMQEVLNYPLFLWLVYLIYTEIDYDIVDRFTVQTVGIAVLSALCYFTKTYMVFIPIVYGALLVFENITERKKIWKKIFLFELIYMLLIFTGNKIILNLNDGIVGKNHYSSQFSNLFPITLETLVSALSCCIIYFVALVFYWGVLPIISPIFHWKEHSKKDKLFLLFIFISFVLLIGEIVLSIVLTEEGNVLFPHKILYRYFQILEIPILIMFIKNIKRYKISGKICTACLTVFGILGIYYIFIGENQRTAIMDAPLFLLMENINRYIIPYFNVLVCVLGIIFICLICSKYKKRQKEDEFILKRSIYVFAFGIIIFFFINLVQLPIYTNIIAKGKVIEQDAIEIAYYCEENKNEYGTIYFICTSDLSYERAINAYLKQEIVFLSKEEMESIDIENALIICSNAYEISQECKEVDIGTQTVKVLKVS